MSFRFRDSNQDFEKFRHCIFTIFGPLKTETNPRAETKKSLRMLRKCDQDFRTFTPRATLAKFEKEKNIQINGFYGLDGKIVDTTFDGAQFDWEHKTTAVRLRGLRNGFAYMNSLKSQTLLSSLFG